MQLLGYSFSTWCEILNIMNVLRFDDPRQGGSDRNSLMAPENRLAGRFEAVTPKKASGN